MLQATRDYLKSLLLVELFKGLSVTGRYLFGRKFTVQYPEEKAPVSPFPWPARPAALSERRGTLHCL